MRGQRSALASHGFPLAVLNDKPVILM